MIDQSAADWSVAANAEVAAQLGRLMIENATMRAQVRAQASSDQALSAENATLQADLTATKDALAKAQAELGLLKDVKPQPPAPAAG